MASLSHKAMPILAPEISATIDWIVRAIVATPRRTPTILHPK